MPPSLGPEPSDTTGSSWLAKSTLSASRRHASGSVSEVAGPPYPAHIGTNACPLTSVHTAGDGVRAR